MRWRHFKEDQVVGLDLELVAKLDMACESSGVPFTITSGRRTAAANKAAGGVSDSSHTRGLAVDLRCSNGSDRFKMVTALWDAGFVRIGIYDKHVHCDIDGTLPQGVIWIGVSH